MTMQEFTDALQKKLSGLPRQEVEDRLDFYREMINDRMEEGESEDEAVRSIGSVEDVAAQIIADIPLLAIAKERLKRSGRLKLWEILLLAIGSPIWASLGIAALSVVLSLYAVLWSAVASVWAIFAAFAACGVCGVPLGLALAFTGGGAAGLAVVGAALVLAGLGILMFFGSTFATQGVIALTKRILAGVKKLLVKEEA